jgi:hypothetical protein
MHALNFNLLIYNKKTGQLLGKINDIVNMQR